MTKNALDNEHGDSPYHLVFGHNPNLPSVLTDKLPALEGTTMSEIVGKQIEIAKHYTRQEQLSPEVNVQNEFEER